MDEKHTHIMIMGIVGIVAIFGLVGILTLSSSNDQSYEGNAFKSLSTPSDGEVGLEDLEFGCCAIRCYDDYKCDDFSSKIARCYVSTTSSCSENSDTECTPSNPCDGGGQAQGITVCGSQSVPCGGKDPLSRSFN